VAGPDAPARRPRVIVVSGPSGAGKGTLIERVLRRLPHLCVAVSATTRPRRPGEEDGREYYFMTPERFRERVAAGDFLEWVTYAGHHYGTLRQEVERILAGGASVVLEIELRGARAVRQAIPGALAVFIRPPSMEELGRRLRARNTEDDRDIAARLETGVVELEAADEFDHVVVNDEVDRAADELARLVEEATLAGGTRSG